MKTAIYALCGSLVGMALAACASSGTQSEASAAPSLPVLEYPAEPADPAPVSESPRVLIVGGTVMTAAGDIFEPGYVLIHNGLIEAVGKGDAPADPTAQVVDATGFFVTPGLIDTHSHMGVYAAPSANAHDDGNEATSPTTPEVWAEHSFWPQDPNIPRAVMGGVTTAQILPGSANLIGGRSFVTKLRPAPSARLMRFPGARQGLKMACGENPKRVYKDSGPSTRMGNVAGYRAAFQQALMYRRAWQSYQRDRDAWEEGGEEDGAEEPNDPPDPPERDFAMETLLKVLDGEIWVHNHCYRADEMHLMLDLAEQFGFTIRSFHHATSAYKLRERLAKKQVGVSTWADWWGFKMEAYDGIPQNAALLSQAGVPTIIHSDSPVDIQRLNQEAAKARTAGRKVGIEISDNEVLRWVTYYPAWALGVHEVTGTLEKGKMADVAIWDAHPFSVYARTTHVFIDGLLIYDRSQGMRPTDFEVGQPARDLMTQGEEAKQ